jgi:hypothetical protein
MAAHAYPTILKSVTTMSSRRAVARRLIATGAGALLGGRALTTLAQEASPVAGEQCVAVAPPADESGIGFVQLLVGGIVNDMPTGPVEIRLSRLTMAPGTTLDAEALPYPALMYIETGTTACPGGAGRMSYGADGTVLEVTTEEGVQYTSAGATQYIPANVPDGAGNEENELMSSIIIEFVPVEDGATPAG